MSVCSEMRLFMEVVFAYYFSNPVLLSWVLDWCRKLRIDPTDFCIDRLSPSLLKVDLIELYSSLLIPGILSP